MDVRLAYGGGGGRRTQTPMTRCKVSLASSVFFVVDPSVLCHFVYYVGANVIFYVGTT